LPLYLAAGGGIPSTLVSASAACSIGATVSLTGATPAAHQYVAQLSEGRLRKHGAGAEPRDAIDAHLGEPAISAIACPIPRYRSAVWQWRVRSTGMGALNYMEIGRKLVVRHFLKSVWGFA
jgi:hypothetical protein